MILWTPEPEDGSQFTTTTGIEESQPCAACRSASRRRTRTRREQAEVFAARVALLAFCAAGAWAIGSLVLGAIAMAQGKG